MNSEPKKISVREMVNMFVQSRLGLYEAKENFEVQLKRHNDIVAAMANYLAITESEKEENKNAGSNVNKSK